MRSSRTRTPCTYPAPHVQKVPDREHETDEQWLKRLEEEAFMEMLRADAETYGTLK